MSKPTRARKLAVVGSRAVGKSSITFQFAEEHFVESYYPTIENQFSKMIRYKGQDYEIEVLDTAGQDEFSILSSKHLVGVHGYVFVYSVTSRASFEMIPIIRDKILNSFGAEYIPAVFVGNKSDLHMQRQVSEQEGKQMAIDLKGAFIETSARHNENVLKSFELVLGEIEKSQNAAHRQESSNSSNCTIT